MAARAPKPGNLVRFPRKLRLKRRRLIRPLFDRSGSDTHSTASGDVRILFRLAPRSDAGEDVPYQVGFAVPRRVGNAVNRNRAKRRLRAAFQVLGGVADDWAIPSDRVLTMMILFRGQDIESGLLDRDLEAALRKIASWLPSGAESRRIL